MNIEEFREYCMGKPGVSERFPFDEETLVFKVMNRMFALTPLDETFRFTLKCEPHNALYLREQHPCVIPAYHMNKKHWNTILVDGTVSDSTLKSWIDDSYNLVVGKLTVRERKVMEKLPKAK